MMPAMLEGAPLATKLRVDAEPVLAPTVSCELLDVLKLPPLHVSVLPAPTLIEPMPDAASEPLAAMLTFVFSCTAAVAASAPSTRSEPLPEIVVLPL